MESYRYVILGAGPSGLAFAHSLRLADENSFVILEKEAEVGGLCRSREVDGKPLDIGGGHFLDLKRKDVLDLLFRFMPREEWEEHRRVSKIRIRGKEVDHPLEANLWQLPTLDQIDFLDSIARAGCTRGEPMPESFADWIRWKLGDCIANEYMLPYNRKIWSTELDRLGTYWLHKLPAVSFRDTLQSCLEHRPYGSLPAHETFLYPKEFGYGEVWRRMGEALGDQLILNESFNRLDLSERVVNRRFRGEHIITTIPWTLWPAATRLPPAIATNITKLVHIPIDVDYHAETLPGDAHWIYDSDENKEYHRIVCRSNFCPGSRGYWTETNSTRSAAKAGWFHRNEFAYPLNTLDKPAAVTSIIKWARERSIYPLGRWGTWEHMNSDVAVSQAITAASELTR